MDMKYNQKYFEQEGVQIQFAEFDGEIHVMLHVDARGELFEGQMKRIYEIEDRVLTMPEFDGVRYVMKRYFLSDSANQVALMRREENVAQSFIQQPPLDGSKVAVWMYMVRNADIETRDGMVVCSRNGYEHLWKMGMTQSHGDSARQTEMIMTEYESQLEKFNATFARNCVRTWFFVRDVDTQYAGMVVARRENFIEQGLTPETHYIASTGIQGLPADTNAIIQMGAYAIAGAWKPGQQRYLYAPTHLNPTSEYGVTFERGVCVEYGDRAHSIISGTASIDNKGNVVHVGDIVRQTRRMWENVEALLKEADMTFDDVAHNIVYLRDMADYAVVKKMFDERFPQIPCVIVLAPVCRPAWLVEMECIAVKQRNNPLFTNF